MATIDKQPCPICNKKEMSLTEEEMEVPYFGKMFLFSMRCNACHYYKADIEAAETKDPSKYVFEVDGEEDLKVRVIKSGEATVKIPHIMTIEPGTASNGYITNIEGILNRVKHMLEVSKDEEEDATKKKKLKNMLKKIQKVIWGNEKIKITIEDPSGNSAIISEKAVKSKLKVKK